MHCHDCVFGYSTVTLQLQWTSVTKAFQWAKSHPHIKQNCTSKLLLLSAQPKYLCHLPLAYGINYGWTWFINWTIKNHCVRGGAAIMGAAMLPEIYGTVSHLVQATSGWKCVHGGVRRSPCYVEKKRKSDNPVRFVNTRKNQSLKWSFTSFEYQVCGSRPHLAKAVGFESISLAEKLGLETILQNIHL